MNKPVNPTKIQDYSEKTWFLGTDVITNEDDLTLLSQGKGAMMNCEEACMISTSHLKEHPGHYLEAGYSKKFNSIIKEALTRGYRWVIFDRDIETTIEE